MNFFFIQLAFLPLFLVFFSSHTIHIYICVLLIQRNEWQQCKWYTRKMITWKLTKKWDAQCYLFWLNYAKSRVYLCDMRTAYIRPHYLWTTCFSTFLWKQFECNVNSSLRHGHWSVFVRVRCACALASQWIQWELKWSV